MKTNILLIATIFLLGSCSKEKTRMQFDLPGTYGISAFAYDYQVVYNIDSRTFNDSTCNDLDNPNNFVGTIRFNADRTGWFYLNPNQQDDTCRFTWKPLNVYDFRIDFEDIGIRYHYGSKVESIRTALMSDIWNRNTPDDIQMGKSSDEGKKWPRLGSSMRLIVKY